MISIAFICCFLSWFCKPSGLVQLRAVVCPGRKSQVRHGFVPLFPPLLPRNLSSGSLASLLARVEAQVDRAHLAVQEPSRSGARSARTSAASALAGRRNIPTAAALSPARRARRPSTLCSQEAWSAQAAALSDGSSHLRTELNARKSHAECVRRARLDQARTDNLSAARVCATGLWRRRQKRSLCEGHCFALRCSFCFVSMRRERLSDTTISSSG
jgi:hypothetical protein